ncbi:MAG: SUF system Fe-S cluster assembly regulator, partial [Acidobacteriota bacterium]
MIRLTRQADYAIVVMTYLARLTGTFTVTARDLAREARLSRPMVSKTLKALTQAGLLTSQRGVHGGYRLAARPDEITIARIITALEGPIGMTDCTNEDPGCCDIELSCPVRSNWQLINEVVHHALEQITLAQMSVSLVGHLPSP